MPPDWTAIIRPGQYAVFLSDVENSAAVRLDGSSVNSAAEHFCLLFDSLSDAQNYCLEAVKKVVRLKCEVFDSEGRVNAPVAVLVNPAYERKIDSVKRARSLMRLGLILSGATFPFFLYAWRAGAGEVWWPVLVGINLFVAGLRLLQWGHGLKEELEYRRDEAARRLAGLKTVSK